MHITITKKKTQVGSMSVFLYVQHGTYKTFLHILLTMYEYSYTQKNKNELYQ